MLMRIHINVTVLSIRKWCFNQKSEKNITDKDLAAAHLVFCEAQSELETGINN